MSFSPSDPQGLSHVFQCSQIRRVCALFRCGACHLHSSGSLNYCWQMPGGGTQGWHGGLWEHICGAYPPSPHKTKHNAYSAHMHTMLSLKFSVASISLVRPPSWNECNECAELFVYGTLLWACGKCSELDRQVSLGNLQEFLFQFYIRSDWARASLEAAAWTCTSAKKLLDEAVQYERCFSYPSLKLPKRDCVYPEQIELAELVHKWWTSADHSHLVYYQAPPGSGKTTGVAFVATYLSRSPFLKRTHNKESAYVVYACHSDIVRLHLIMHLEACLVHCLHISNDNKHAHPANSTVGTERPPTRHEASESHAASCWLNNSLSVQVGELLTTLEEWPDDCEWGSRPTVLICDISCAIELSKNRVADALFFDEVCSSASMVCDRMLLVQNAPRCTILMSSFLPPASEMHLYAQLYQTRWPACDISTIFSRRPQPSLTAYLQDGSVILPHNSGVPLSEIKQFPHLLRFYSATALKAMIEDSKIDADVELDYSDLNSTKAVRMACLRLIEEGKICERKSRAGNKSVSDWRQHVWSSCMRTSTPGDVDASLIFASDFMQCLEDGLVVWSNYPDADFSDIPTDAPEIVLRAARKGVLVLGTRQECDLHKIGCSYISWAHLLALNKFKRPVCVVASSAVVHGLHISLSNLYFWSSPMTFEMSVHACGRIGRDIFERNLTVHIQDEAMAEIIFVPSQDCHSHSNIDVARSE